MVRVEDLLHADYIEVLQVVRGEEFRPLVLELVFQEKSFRRLHHHLEGQISHPRILIISQLFK